MRCVSGGLQAQCDKVCGNPKVLKECVVCQEACTSSVHSVWGIQRDCRAELLSYLCTGESMVFETLETWSWSMDFMTMIFFLYPKEIGAVLTADQQAIHNSNSFKGRFGGMCREAETPADVSVRYAVHKAILAAGYMSPLSNDRALRCGDWPPSKVSS